MISQTVASKRLNLSTLEEFVVPGLSAIAGVQRSLLVTLEEWKECANTDWAAQCVSQLGACL